MKPFFVLLILSVLVVTRPASAANGSGLEIKSVYYCSTDFSMMMSNGERWVVLKSQVGAEKLGHFISMAMFMMAAGKKTNNVFPGEPISWCGNSNVRPIHILSFEN